MAPPMLFKVAVGLAALSIVLVLAGFASNYWFTSERRGGTNFGLWAICYYGKCRSYGQALVSVPTHAYIARFCTAYELVAVIAGLVLICLFIYKTPRQNFVKSGYSLFLSAGILGFLGAVIFIGREKSGDTSGVVSVSWSGILVIFAAIAQIVAGVLIILPIRRGEVEFEQA